MYNLYVVLFVLLLDVVGFTIMMPAIVSMKEVYWVSDTMITAWPIIHAICAFFAAPVLWQLSDKYGRKNPLLACILWTVASYTILAITSSYWMFLLGRAINGITWWNISIVQASITDLSPTSDQKTKHFWYMGAIFGIGFVVGPLLWSLLLSWWDIYTIFYCGVIVSCIECVVVYRYYTTTNTPVWSKVILYNPCTVLWKYITNTVYTQLLSSITLLNTGTMIINAGMALYMANNRHTSWEEYGYILVISWIIVAINLAICVPHIWKKYFTLRQCMIILHSVGLIWYMMLASTQSEVFFCIIYYITMVGTGIYNPIYNTAIMQSTNPNDIGEVSGMMGGLHSVWMMLWAICAWLLFLTQTNIFYGSLCCFLLSLCIIYKK